MTYESWLKQAEKNLAKAGISSAALDARLILGHALELNPTAILAHPDTQLADNQIKKLKALLDRRIDRQPMAHLTGQREFYGLDIQITPDVLTPRAETELMVELVIKDAPSDGCVLDVGTGSGAIAIAIAKHRPDLQVSATDVSSKALKVAQANIRHHGVGVNLIESDLFDQITGRFDVITANLPYLADDAELMPEVEHEPRVALVGGADGLELYRRFFAATADHLMPGGQVYIEADPWQHEALARLWQQRLD